MDTVANIDASKLEKTGKSPRTIFEEYFASVGNSIYSDVYGDISLGKSSVKSEIRHGITAEKIASFEAIPAVIEQGKVIFHKTKGGDDERIVVCAPIKIGEYNYYMGVMLQRDTQKQYLYLHNVAIEKEAQIASETHRLTTGVNESDSRLFITSILQKAINVKIQRQKIKNVLSEQFSLSPATDDIGPAANVRKDSENLDFEAKKEYNISDLYTATDEFVKEVTEVDRHSFARSLANKTSGMSDGKIKTIYIYCRERVYTFVANGYMKGYVLMSEPVEKLNVRKRRFAEYYENNIDSNRTVVSLWSQPISNQSGRQVDNALFSSGRRGPVIDDSFSKDSSDSTRAGYNERVRENTYSEKEIDEIVRRLREMEKSLTGWTTT